MILEGFEIENWSCIKRASVTDLPPTGVVVLHGPNGTGKSSIIEALRACLMDNKSTSKALDRGVPKNSGEKPRVSVTFRSAGQTWRITKQFNSKESKLESRTPAGQWKLETADPSEAHERTRQMTGGSDSSLGLHQLLWLTQAEFHLPDPKKFDTDVQSRLRGVLGVLQTPLDDQFLGRVKERWSRWFGARSKPGEKPKLKKGCPLDKNQEELARLQVDLSEIEKEFQNFEQMIERSNYLELRSRDLRRQVEANTPLRDALQNEYEKSLNRIEAYRSAEERVSLAKKDLDAREARRRQRVDKEQSIREAEESAEKASLDVDEKGRQLRTIEQTLLDRRREGWDLEVAGRTLQARRDELSGRLQGLALKEKLEAARKRLELAEATNDAFEGLKHQARENLAPDLETLKTLEENRTHAARSRADLEAAAIALTLDPDASAAAPRLLIDGASAEEFGRPTDGSPIRHSVRRRAEIIIPGWGRVELTRGSDARSLDQIEADLGESDRQFAQGLALFGIAAADPSALDKLRGLAVEKTARDPDLKHKQEELRRLAPKGLDPLRLDVTELEKRHRADESERSIQSQRDDLPADVSGLEHLDEQLKKDAEANVKRIDGIQKEIGELEIQIEGDPEARPAALGSRQREATAKERLLTLNTTVRLLRDELDRMPTTKQAEDDVLNAIQALEEAREGLEAAKLSEDEETIRDRLDNANEGLRAIESQLTEAQKEFHQIEGAMRLSEGLHQRRAAGAARFEVLKQQTEWDTLESQAYDRLYALFEECREKQLGTVMGPIHDRVLRWMQLLRIGGYHAIRFNDQFLPESLIAGDGAVELSLGEESTGTIEQIALMVRLALGSTLSTPDEPVVAMLDDPLTHSDVIRLDRMRAVLKAAASGDPASTTPAGPMQIMVFSCHPEWFAIDGARIIDLSKPDVLSKH